MFNTVGSANQPEYSHALWLSRSTRSYSLQKANESNENIEVVTAVQVGAFSLGSWQHLTEGVLGWSPRNSTWIFGLVQLCHDPRLVGAEFYQRGPTLVMQIVRTIRLGMRTKKVAGINQSEKLNPRLRIAASWYVADLLRGWIGRLQDFDCHKRLHTQRRTLRLWVDQSSHALTSQ